MKLSFYLMEIFYSLYIHMALLPLTETCLSRALNVTCYLAESMLLCWLNVMFNFHNFFIRNQSVPQETNLHTSYLFFFFFSLKLIAFVSIAKASHLGEKKLSDCFNQFKLNWNAFIRSSGWRCYEKLQDFNIKDGVSLKNYEVTHWLSFIS